MLYLCYLLTYYKNPGQRVNLFEKHWCILFSSPLDTSIYYAFYSELFGIGKFDNTENGLLNVVEGKKLKKIGLASN